jgi:hypothetical protein
VGENEGFREVWGVASGEAAIPRRFERIVRGFRERYGIRLLTVTADDVRVGDAHGRLALWAATPEDFAACRTGDGANYDPEKQRFALSLAPRGRWFVYFADWQREAASAFTANAGRPADLEAARQLLDDDRIWKVDAAFGLVVVFLRTDAEVELLRGGAEAARWEQSLWEVFSAAGPRDLMPRERFRMRLDSKQNLDENFAGSTGYYWR